MARNSGVRIAFVLVAVLAAATSVRAGDVSVKLDSGAGFSVKNSTGAIERLRVDEATGNVSRNGALFVHTTGASSTFIGDGAGNLATTGNMNTAVGAGALQFVTTGITNAAFGTYALHYNTTGSSNSAFGQGALLTNTSGSSNTAVGRLALRSNTTGGRNSGFGTGALSYNDSGSDSAAFGFGALSFNTSGHSNSAFGAYALRQNTTGVLNSAFGQAALTSNTGSSNSAFGRFTLRFNTTGYGNSAFGQGALETNSTGSGNVALGRSAGFNQTTGSNNIYIANAGVAGESGRIRIGTVGTHSLTTIAGIYGVASGGSPVLVTATGALGTTISSIRFKEAVRDMGPESDVLMRLRPVVYRYKKEVIRDGKDGPEYGLIAEEVAKVAPGLVEVDVEGRPHSVKYHVLPALLVNEAQAGRRIDAEQQRTIEAQRELIASLSARLAALEGSAAR